MQLGRVVAAQKAFDEAVDAIDRSGLKKDMRKGLAVELQEAFIKLVKDEDISELINNMIAKLKPQVRVMR